MKPQRIEHQSPASYPTFRDYQQNRRQFLKGVTGSIGLLALGTMFGCGGVPAPPHPPETIPPQGLLDSVSKQAKEMADVQRRINEQTKKLFDTRQNNDAPWSLEERDLLKSLCAQQQQSREKIRLIYDRLKADGTSPVFESTYEQLGLNMEQIITALNNEEVTSDLIFKQQHIVEELEAITEALTTKLGGLIAKPSPPEMNEQDE